MHSFLDAKTMARTLRSSLADRGVPLSHSDCLELVARQFGLPNWNVLAAMIEAAGQPGGDLAMPAGWSMSGHSDRTLFRFGLDPAAPGTALIESRFSRDSGVAYRADQFAVMMQVILADAYRGRRLRLAASLRTEDVDAASIWMRIDRSPGYTLRFENLLHGVRDGALTGTNGWTELAIVLDVPDEAATIHFGFLLKRYGRAWARGFRIEEVGEAAGMASGLGRYHAAPTNLDFAAASRPAA